MRISIRAPARGATTVSVCAEFSGSNFNPRSREGSDIDWVSNPLCNAISIRTPARGATRTWTRLPRLCRFQSALPRGERHGASVEYKPTMTTISIRAPARGATSGHQSGFSYVSISIRAPARGATKSGKHTVVYSVISIRAPARGATKSRNTSYPGLDISIRAPARGATHGRRQTGYITKFQSALPRGERQVDRVSFCM